MNLLSPNIGIQNYFTCFKTHHFGRLYKLILLVYDRIKCLFILYGNVLTNVIRKFCP